MTKKLDDSLFDDSTTYTEPQASRMDDSLFDDDNTYQETSTASVIDEGPGIIQRNLDPIEALKTTLGATAGYGAGKAASPLIETGVNTVSNKVLDPFAETLAYRGAGGQSGMKAGIELNNAMIDKNAGNTVRGIQELADAGAYDDGVTPRSVGRQILDKELLGPAGLGTKAKNAERAKANLMKTSQPTNALLDSIEEYPVFQDPIFRRMKEIVGYDELNPTVGDQANLKGKIDKLNETSFAGVETPMQAERAKRDLMRTADFADPEKTVKNAMNTAQAIARKEAVENAVLQTRGPKVLEEFKRLKAQSGSAGIASDLLGEVYQKSQKPFAWQGLIGTGIDYISQRGAGIGAEALDTASKVAKAGSKAAGPALGTLIGTIGGAAAMDDQTDSADFIPGLDQATAAGSAFEDKAIRNEVKALENYRNSPAALDRQTYLQNTIDNTPEEFRNGFAYRQAQEELKKLQGRYKPSDDLITGAKTLKESNPDQLMELAKAFQTVKGADKFVAPLENAAQANSEEERQARLFGLYQQPAFRQLLKKGNKVEE